MEGQQPADTQETVAALPEEERVQQQAEEENRRGAGSGGTPKDSGDTLSDPMRPILEGMEAGIPSPRLPSPGAPSFSPLPDYPFTFSGA